MNGPQVQKKGGNPYAGLQRQPAFNGNGSKTVPAFGLVRVIGTQGNGAFIVDQPNGASENLYVNGPAPIRPGGYGVVSRAFPIWCVYDPASGTPAIGDAWGAAAGSYLLKKGVPGFIVQSNPATNGPPRVLIDVEPNPAWLSVSAASPSNVYLGRQVNDGALNGTAVLASLSGNFTTADVGATLLGSGIPANTTISSVTNSASVVMSNNATVTAKGVQVTIVTAVIKGYQSSLASWDNRKGGWSLPNGINAWFTTPQVQNGVYSAAYTEIYGNYPFQCDVIGADAYGVPICCLGAEPASLCSTSNNYTPGGAGYPLIVLGIDSTINPGLSAQITLGASFCLFGSVTSTGVAYGSDLYVVPGPTATGQGVASQAYQGDTGADAGGNQFLNGWNTAIGGGNFQGVIDEGSDW